MQSCAVQEAARITAFAWGTQPEDFTSATAKGALPDSTMILSVVREQLNTRDVKYLWALSSIVLGLNHHSHYPSVDILYFQATMRWLTPTSVSWNRNHVKTRGRSSQCTKENARKVKILLPHMTTSPLKKNASPVVQHKSSHTFEINRQLFHLFLWCCVILGMRKQTPRG